MEASFVKMFAYTPCRHGTLPQIWPWHSTLRPLFTGPITFEGRVEKNVIFSPFLPMHVGSHAWLCVCLSDWTEICRTIFHISKSIAAPLVGRFWIITFSGAPLVLVITFGSPILQLSSVILFIILSLFFLSIIYFYTFSLSITIYISFKSDDQY